MSLLIGLLAFDDPVMRDRVKFGILASSLIAVLAG
jgi:NhaA family Na+:H+ antiporter